MKKKSIQDFLFKKYGLEESYTNDLSVLPSIIKDVAEPCVKFIHHLHGPVYTYSKEVFLSLESMPAIPVFDEDINISQPSINRRWTYDLKYAQDYVRKYGILDIGTVLVDDVLCILHLDMYKEESFTINFNQSVANGAEIQIFKDSSDNLLYSICYNNAGNISHAFELEPGKYLVRIIKKDSSCKLSFIENTQIIISQGTDNMFVKVIEVGSDVNYIPTNAFNKMTGLYNVTIPGSVTDIGTSILAECNNLNYLVLPNSLRKVPGFICNKNSYNLKRVTIPDSVTEICNAAFQLCEKLDKCIIPDTVKDIQEYAFYGCINLDNVNIPHGVKKINDYTFFKCSRFNNIVLPDSVEEIGTRSFSNCYAMADFKWSNSLKKIGPYAFANCVSFANLELPDSVEEVGNLMFLNCLHIQHFKAPKSLKVMNNIINWNTISGNDYIESVMSLYTYLWPYPNIMYYDFSKLESVPTLTGSIRGTGNQRGGAPADPPTFFIPANLFEEWTNATNWVNYKYTSYPVSDNIKQFSGYMTGNKNIVPDRMFYVDGMTWGEYINSPYNTNNLKEYKLPDDISINDTIEPDILYDFKTGVYIVDSIGNFVDCDSWTEDMGSTGVVLLHSHMDIIISPDGWYTTDGTNYEGEWNGNKRSAFGGYGTTITGLVDDVYSGPSNTDKIIAQIGGKTDSYSQYYTGAPAAEYCRAYTNGYKYKGEWYLPTFAEMKIIYPFSEIYGCMTKIGGNTFGKYGQFIITSSPQDQDSSSCCIHRNDSNVQYHNPKYVGLYVIPVAAYTPPELITFTIQGTEYQTYKGMTWGKWVESEFNTGGFYTSGIFIYPPAGTNGNVANSEMGDYCNTDDVIGQKPSFNGYGDNEYFINSDPN